MLRESRILREWFDIVAGALKAKPTAELTLEDFRNHFAATGEDLAGTPYDPSNREHVDRLDECLEQVLPLFQERGLISVRYDRNRYTARLGLQVPENVARLTEKGKRLSERLGCRKICYWTVAVLANRIASFANKYKWVATVATMSMAVAKFIFEWDFYTSGAAALIAGLVALVVHAMH